MLVMELNKLKGVFMIGLIFLITNGMLSQSPTKYWVKFKDKIGSPYSITNPSAYLSAKSITRRTNQGIAIDVTDLPVNPSYVSQVNATGATVFQCSKWMNAAIVIISSPAQLTAINTLSCVLSTTPVGRYKQTTQDIITPITPEHFKTSQTASSSYNYGAALTQVSQINANCMHSLGFRGQNVTIAVMDGGFQQVDINPVFDSLRNEGRLLGTRDYVAGNQSVFEDDSHGALVLSVITGNSPGNLIGTAPKASVWLLRSEDVGSEKIIEENNWVVAAEFADSIGVDITTTSLGYTTFDNASDDHTYADLNGRTSVASIASTMAARKGIFVLNAAGNEGSGSWHYVGVPADADSICTVGAVNGSGVHAGFSSSGPTSDGRIKPEVSTMGDGTILGGPGNNFFAGNGTSFACPIMAGAVACLIQANPTKTNMQILQAIKATASRTTNPDNDYGYGIPDICAANNLLHIPTSVFNESVSRTLTVFPNPAQDKITWTLDQSVQGVLLTDVVGKEIPFIMTESDHAFTIQLDEQMAHGIYFITVKTENQVMNAKFIKE